MVFTGTGQRRCAAVSGKKGGVSRSRHTMHLPNPENYVNTYKVMT